MDATARRAAPACCGAPGPRLRWPSSSSYTDQHSRWRAVESHDQAPVGRYAARAVRLVRVVPRLEGNPGVMASIRHEIAIDAPPEHIWDVLRDVGAVHERLLPGRVTATRVERD